jgi:Protein of unknown function (DUF1579)
LSAWRQLPSGSGEKPLKRIATAISIMLLMFVTAFVQAQSSNRMPPPELKKWGAWIGNWALSGNAKDTPTGPEYRVDWYLHEHWILNGFFVQVDQTWKGNGQELHSLEILSYDPVKKIHTSSGFSSDGSTWVLTATFDDATTIEVVEAAGPTGQITNCRTTWVFSNDGMALSGTQECEQNGLRWKSFSVEGTKSKTG